MFFVCWLAICRSAMRRRPFRFCTNAWLSCLFHYDWVPSVVSVFRTKAFMLLPVCCLYSHFFIDVIWIAKALNFNEAQFISIFLLWTMLLISCLRNLCVTQSLETFLCFHLKVFCFGTYTKSLIPCHLNINLLMHWLWIVFPFD